MAVMPKNDKSGPHGWGRGGLTQFAQQLESDVTASSLVGCVVWSRVCGAARSLDQRALRLSVIKRIRQIDVKYITHMQSVLAKNGNVQKNERPCKNNISSVRSKMRDRRAQNDI